MIKTLKEVGGSLLVLMLVLAGADIVLGFFMSEQPAREPQRSLTFREWASDLDIRLYPKPDELTNFPHLKKEGYRLRTDAKGFITGPEEIGKSPDIVFLGASTTEALFVEEDKRWPYLVSRYLQHSTDGSPVRTLNAGSTGSHALHALLAMIGKVIAERPEILVVMLNGNDLRMLSMTGSYWVAPKSRDMFVYAPDDAAFDGFGQRFQSLAESLTMFLYPHILKKSRNYLRQRAEQNDSRDEWGQFRASATEVDQAAIVRDYRSALESIIGVAHAWDIDVVLMTEANRIFQGETAYQPKTGRPSNKRFMHGYIQFNDTIRELAAEHELLLIDLDQDVPQDNRYIYDWLHLTTEGSELVAETIAGSLARRFESLQLVESSAD
jgi:lysophospholipase L1-like esterase